VSVSGFRQTFTEIKQIHAKGEKITRNSNLKPFYKESSKNKTWRSNYEHES
jgi:hypothetical protein